MKLSMLHRNIKTTRIVIQIKMFVFIISHLIVYIIIFRMISGRVFDGNGRDVIVKDIQKSEIISRNFINKTLQLKLDKLFEIQIKPGLMALINPTTPKYTPTVNASYILDNKDFCSQETELTVVIMILSAPKHFQRRNAIRETWGNSSYYSNYGKLKIMFLLGATSFAEVQENIAMEFEMFGDILQGYFIDSYHNLSLKSVLGFKWLKERCRNAKYIIKTDDDIVLNMFQIFEKYFPVMSVDHYNVHCERRIDSAIVRQRSEKAYVEPNQLKGLRAHMPYCHGQYVMFINDIVPYLFKSVSNTPFFWIDDVFSYGIVMNNIPGLKYKQVYSNEYIDYSKLNTMKCWRESMPRCEHVYFVVDNANQIRDVWLSLKFSKQRKDYSWQLAYLNLSSHLRVLTRVWANVGLRLSNSVNAW